MKVTIRLSTEISYSVTIPDNSTVEDLRNTAKVACPATSKLPSEFKLIYNGEKLTPLYKPLDFFHMKPEMDELTVILMNNGSEIGLADGLAGAAVTSSNTNASTRKTKTKRNKCSFKSCSSAPLRMVGTCSHCQGKFCAKHRLLEDHICQGLQFCKENAHERNAMKLQSESTIASKV